MGRSVTPTFRVEYQDQTNVRSNSWHQECWDCKRYGRPTEANIEKWRKLRNESFAPGGVNAHVSQAHGFVLHVSKVRVVRQTTNEVVAGVSMPMFEVV